MLRYNVARNALCSQSLQHFTFQLNAQNVTEGGRQYYQRAGGEAVILT